MQPEPAPSPSDASPMPSEPSIGEPMEPEVLSEINIVVGPEALDTLTNHVDTLTTALYEHSIAIERAILGTNGTPWLAILGGALIGASSAFIFNLIHWFIARRHVKCESLADCLIAAINSLEKEAVTFWLYDATTMGAVKRKKSEILIKSKISGIRSQTENLSACLPILRANKKGFLEKTDKFNSELFDCATGSDFESPKRASNTNVATKISMICRTYISDVSSIN